MTANDGAPEPEGEPRFSFVDKRKVDPATGKPRSSGPDLDDVDREAAKLVAEEKAKDAENGTADPKDAQIAELTSQVAELQEELKRAQAEYVNSRRRIEMAADQRVSSAVGQVLSSLISVLDDIELGRQHGDVTEGTPFHAIATKLEDTLGSHGLTRYGAVGEEFDPALHEALMHEESDQVEVNTIKTVLQPGYQMHDKVLRPARVATHGPE
ncbi:nucleotide exchange factor GrpE [Devriesea agamarum]|uniref:nucleotide exchange factor GrpE n=1 Tax=Devriesea agamarum TaxID=472569 RepID=UPI00071DD2C9|nr:nucleotide exchange factor GrpE [Devriesea agamarum]